MSASLDLVISAVARIPGQTEPIEPVLTSINDDLGAARESLEGLLAKKVDTVPRSVGTEQDPEPGRPPPAAARAQPALASRPMRRRRTIHPRPLAAPAPAPAQQTGGGLPPCPGQPVTRWWLALVAAAVAAILGVGAIVSGPGPSGPAASHCMTGRGPTRAGAGRAHPGRVPGSRRALLDLLSRRLDASDPQVELLVTRPDGSASLLVRVTSLELGLGRVTPRELPALKPLTDRLVRSDRRVALLRPAAPVSLGGLPGYRYLYTFPDAATGQPTAHLHYFPLPGTNDAGAGLQVARATRLRSISSQLAPVAVTFRASTASH